MQKFRLILTAGVAALAMATSPLAVAQSPLGSSSVRTAQPAPGVRHAPEATAEKEARFEHDTIRLLNNHREAHGLEPVSVDSTLMSQSKEWSEKMAATGDFKHGEWNVFENIAYNHAPDDSSRLFQQWRNSPGHNRNILHPEVSKVGVGVEITPEGRVYGTMQLTWE